jgi:hypothetical protein
VPSIKCGNPGVGGNGRGVLGQLSGTSKRVGACLLHTSSGAYDSTFHEHFKVIHNMFNSLNVLVSRFHYQ